MNPDLAAHHPVLVYGTLRTDQSNHWLLAGRARAVARVSVPGYQLVTNGSFPYAVPVPGERVRESIVCEVMEVHPEHLVDVMRDVDRLEGFDARSPATSMYLREVLTGQAADGTIHRGWMYVPTQTTLESIAHLPAVAEGDWALRDAEPAGA